MEHIANPGFPRHNTKPFTQTLPSQFYISIKAHPNIIDAGCIALSVFYCRPMNLLRQLPFSASFLCTRSAISSSDHAKSEPPWRRTSSLWCSVLLPVLPFRAVSVCDSRKRREKELRCLSVSRRAREVRRCVFVVLWRDGRAGKEEVVLS